LDVRGQAVEDERREVKINFIPRVVQSRFCISANLRVA
jgi:hypothetical protein